MSKMFINLLSASSSMPVSVSAFQIGTSNIGGPATAAAVGAGDILPAVNASQVHGLITSPESARLPSARLFADEPAASSPSLAPKKKEGVPSPELDHLNLIMGARTSVTNELFKKYAEVVYNGVHSAADIRLTVGFIKTLGAYAEGKGDGRLVSSGRFLRKLSELFEHYNISASISTEDGSFCRHTYREYKDYENKPAAEFGIFLKNGSGIFTCIHEMTHAIPFNEWMRLVRETFPGEDLKMLELPRWPVKYDSEFETFVKLAGRSFRAEAYANISEQVLNEVFSSDKVDHSLSISKALLQSKSEERMAASIYEDGLKKVMVEGYYIGHNHLVLYNLASFFRMAKMFKIDPNSLKKEKFDDVSKKVENIGFTDIQGDLAESFCRSRKQLEAIMADPYHPLHPVINRTIGVIRAETVDINGTKDNGRFSMHPVERRAGNKVWLKENPDTARRLVEIAGGYGEAMNLHINHILAIGGLRAVAAYAFFLPDEDIPRFWSAVTQIVSKKGLGAFQLALPLLAHGYVKQAARSVHWPHDISEAKAWINAFFFDLAELVHYASFDQASKWIDVIEKEAARKFEFPYRLKVLDTVRAYGSFAGDDGWPELQEFLMREVPDPDSIVKKLHEMIQTGRYRNNLFPEWPFLNLFRLAREVVKENKGSDGEFRRKVTRIVLKIGRFKGGGWKEFKKAVKEIKGISSFMTYPDPVLKLLQGLFNDGKYVIRGEYEIFRDIWGGKDNLRHAYKGYLESLPSFPALKKLQAVSERLQENGRPAPAGRLGRLIRKLIPEVVSNRKKYLDCYLGWGYREKTMEHELAGRKRDEEALDTDDTFLDIIQKLGGTEGEVLSPPLRMAEELSFLAGLKNGGWELALRYVDNIPPSFTKTDALGMFSGRMASLPKPTAVQFKRFLTNWKASLSEVLKVNSAWSMIELGWANDCRNVRGLGKGPIITLKNRDKVVKTAKRLLKGVREGSIHETRYAQKNYLQMLEAIPEGAAFEPLRREIRGLLKAPSTRGLMLNPEFLLPHAVNDDVTRSEIKQHILLLAHDPSLAVVTMKARDAFRAGEPALIRSAAGEIAEIIRDRGLPWAFKAPYLSPMMELSVAAFKAGDRALSRDIYREAKGLSQRLNGVTKREFGRYFHYHGSDEKARGLDLDIRYNKFRATWEGEFLSGLSRMAALASGAERVRYKQEMVRIIESESVFDLFTCSDFTRAALELNKERGNGQLVIELFERAIRSAASQPLGEDMLYDHVLIEAIDSSNIERGDKDDLLAGLASIAAKRVLVEMGRNVEVGFMTAVNFGGRMVEEFSGILDLVEERGYRETEGIIWEGIGEVTKFVKERFPPVLMPMIVGSVIQMIAIRRPEIFNRDNKAELLALTGSGELVENIFQPLFGRESGGPGLAYSHLPTMMQIKRKKLNDVEIDLIRGEFRENIEDTDPYILDLYNAAILNYIRGSQKLPSIKNCGKAYPVRKLLERYGFDDLEAFMARYPRIAAGLLFSNLSKGGANALRGLLFECIRSKMPVEVRRAAFKGLITAKHVSPYLERKFEDVSGDPAREEAFLENVKHIWVTWDNVAMALKQVTAMIQMHMSGVPREDRIDDLLGAHNSLELASLPDWFIAPLFEDMLKGEMESIMSAVNRPSFIKVRLKRKKIGTRIEKEMRYELDKGGPAGIEPGSLYDLLLGLMKSWEKWISVESLQNTEEFIPTFMEGIEKIYRKYHALGIERPLGMDKAMLVKAAKSLIERNEFLAAVGRVEIPRAFKNVHPTLRMALSGYLALAPTSHYIKIISALKKTEAKDEDEVLSTFFRVTNMGKLAQFLARQEGIVPEADRKRLAQFEKDIKPSTLQEVQDTLRDAYGDRMEEIFRMESFEFLHAGTVGEVWRATLSDGRQVAIKVLTERKRRNLERSLVVLEKLCRHLNYFRHQLFGGFDLEALFRKYREDLIAEMKYLNEYKNLKGLKSGIEGHNFIVPEYIHKFEENGTVTNLSRNNILVMGYMNLVDIDKIESAEDRELLIEKSGEYLANAIFRDGNFYEDWHGGNIQWEPEAKRPVLLDFGLRGELGQGQIDLLVRFLVSVSSNSPLDAASAMASICHREPAAGGRGDPVKGLETRIVTILAGRPEDARQSKYIQKIFAEAEKLGFEIDTNYALFIKAVTTWENQVRRLNPERADFTPFATKAIMERIAERSSSPFGKGG